MRARRRVPRVVARAPWEDAREGLEEVVECPRDDDVVVDAADPRDEHHAYAETCSNKVKQGLNQRLHSHYQGGGYIRCQRSAPCLCRDLQQQSQTGSQSETSFSLSGGGGT